VIGTFRSLRSFNYRVWAGGALVSNVGTWMQRTAQDWLVLTQLTHHNATAVGFVMALQYGPHLLLLPLTGFAADHFDRRRILMTTQAALGTLALGLGILTVAGLVQLWHVYVFAFLLGCVTAFDSPANQTFVSELVGEADLSNAVGLNSTSFNAARMIGPAIAGILIAAVGTGWVFLLNAASFVAVLCALGVLRVEQLHRSGRAAPTAGSFLEGFRYVRSRRDLRTILLMLFLIGTFGLGCLLAGIAPNYWLFAAALTLIGVAALTFTNSTNSLLQLATEPAMRGRVMAIRLAIALGGTPIGAPIVGWVADSYGPRWALSVGAASGFAAASVVVIYLTKYCDLRLRLESGRLSLRMHPR
jgi:MFS family permease